ncbi:anion transporter [Pycnococcus provasolii]
MVFLITIAIATCYADRSNISVAAISMAKELEWSKTTEGVVLSAFFVGYAGTQLVGGRAADVAGGKRVLAVGVAAWSIATALTPLCARGGIGTLLFIRCALGAGEGVAFPAAHSLIARHVPMRRRSVAVAAITSASYVGAAAAFLLTPTIIESSGWPAAFYGFAAAALVWIPAWLPLDLPPPNKPSESPSLPQSTSAIWRLARRKEVWAIMAAQYGQSVGLYGLLSWLPTYYDDVYDIPLSNLPALTVAPYILQGVVGVGAGWFADRLISGGVRNRDVRVLLQSIGMLGPATALLFVASAELPAESAAIAIDIGLGLSALTLGGVSVNHLDISPRNAGSVFALGNTCATLGGLVAVPAIGRILDNTHDWSLVFGLISAHFVVGVVAYVAWCGGERVDD